MRLGRAWVTRLTTPTHTVDVVISMIKATLFKADGRTDRLL